MSPYILIRKALIDYIKEKKLEIGEKLPPEDRLACLLGVSRVTLREALRQLREEGLIYSKRGSGTYVSGNVKDIVGTLDINLGSTRMIEIAGCEPGVTFHEVELINADGALADKLKVKKGCGIVLLKRVRTADKRPVVFSMDYLGPEVATIFLAVNDRIMSLFKLIEESGIKIGNSFAEIYPENCTEELAEKLSYKTGSPILALKQVIVGQKGSPLFYGEDYFRPDCFKFSINRRRNSIQ
ncbi:MAG TPA: GntR family transcriptional regulator [Spirochaetes bacterium]|nr:GntR family transcriptional regulator [Spirochaetota bacterium]